MKKLGIGLVAVLVLLVAVVLLAPTLVPQAPLKSFVQDRVRAATGRELTLGGDLSLSLVPRLAVTAQDVALAGADPGEKLARIGELQLTLAPLPLVRGAVEVDRFVLVRPEIHLAIDAQGRPNWRAPEPAPAPAPSTEPAADGEGPSPGPSAPMQLALGEVRIEDGIVSFTDARVGTTRRAEAITLDASLPGLDSPFQAKGSARVDGKDVTLALEAAQPRALLEGGRSPLALTVDGPGIEFSASGSGGADGFAGDVGLVAADLAAALAWAGSPAQAGAALPSRVSLEGKLEATLQRIVLDGLAVAADANRLTGKLTADLAGERPVVQGELAGEVLDLRPYLAAAGPAPAKETQAGTGESTGGDAPAPAPGGWPDTPLGLPAGLPADVDLKLAVAGVTTGRVDLGPTRVAMRGRADRIRVDVEEAQLYGGNLSGHLRMLEAKGGPEIRLRVDGDGLQARPLLSAAAGFDKLEGTMRTGIEVTGPGTTLRRLIAGLDGRGSVKFTDGAYVGVDIAGLIRSFTDPEKARSGPQRTDFAELGGSFTIADGILTNQDLLMLAPLLRLSGAGRIDLPRQAFVDYRVVPRAVATKKGQGGKRDVRGLSVPFTVDGPWASPRISPDLAGAAAALLEDPEAMQALGLDKIIPKGAKGDAVQDVLKGLLGGKR